MSIKVSKILKKLCRSTIGFEETTGEGLKQSECTRMFTETLFIIAKKWEKLKGLSID